MSTNMNSNMKRNTLDKASNVVVQMHFGALSSSTAKDLATYSNTSHLPAKRWVAHVSNKTHLVSTKELVLHLSPTDSFNAFDIIEKLLFAKTCRVIHTDAKISLNQIAILKEMALFSGTDLVFIGDKDRFNRRQLFALEEA